MSIIVRPQNEQVEVTSIEVPDATGLGVTEREARCQAATNVAKSLFPKSIGEAVSNLIEDHQALIGSEVYESDPLYPHRELDALVDSILLNTAQIALDAYRIPERCAVPSDAITKVAPA